ncbi:FkbM family methyltransferase [Halosimplex halophilum]
MATIAVSAGRYKVEVQDTETQFIVADHDEYERLRAMTEFDVLSSLLSDLQDDDVFFDVGANIGVYSCLVGASSADIDVVSFEPHPKNADRLRDNLNLNDIEASVQEQALSDTIGDVTLSIAVESTTVAPGHNLIEVNESLESYGEGSVEQRDVEMQTGDELVENGELPQPTVVKIDVEGAELKALRGMEQVLSQDACRVVYCEVHSLHLPKFDSSETEIHELLKSCGFTIEIADDAGDKYHIRAYK